MNTHDVQNLIDFINGARRKGVKAGLSNMRALLSELRHPEADFKKIHVAGTNGKGSTCAFIERALRENGYKTGLYTSPYLTRYQERIRIGGVPIDDELLLAAGEKLRRAFDALAQRGIYLTTFELGTALAFIAFSQSGVDYAVIETGIGGRLDSTNVITPVLSVVAAIGLDHTELLGGTLTQIALEKAGIAKPGVPLVLAPQPDAVLDVFRAHLSEVGAPLIALGEGDIAILHEDARGARFALDGQVVQIHLAGRHQIANAALALRALRALGANLSDEKTLLGIARTEWPGRLEWLSNDLLIDGAHNEQAARSLRAYLDAYLLDRKMVLLTGMMRDKAYEACARVLFSAFDCVITTQVDWPKALGAEELAEVYKSLGAKAEAVKGVEAALARARETGQLVVVAGSLYLTGDVKALYSTSSTGQ